VDAHLLPHIVRHAESTHSPWRVDASELVDARLVVDLWWERDERDPQPLQADTLALLGAFVEASSHVRRRWADGVVEYDIATGMLDGDRVFATHGHLVTLRIRGPRGTPNA
jgi:hypothetical protein